MKRIYQLLITLFVVLGTTSFVYADVFTNATRFVSDVQGNLLGMTTALAGVGVITGAGMKKLSLGDEHKIRSGNKVMATSIVGWAVANGVPLILTTIQPYLS